MNFKSSKYGFTIIELLVVIFIVGVLSSLLFADFRSGKKRYELSQAAQKLASDIRNAQGKAMGGIKSGSFDFCAYCVRASQASPNSYIFYMDSSSSSCDHNYAPSNDEIIKTINLTENVEIRSTQKNGSSVSSLNVCFEPPKPKTFINNDSTSDARGKIILGIKNSSDIEVIDINSVGLVEID